MKREKHEKILYFVIKQQNIFFLRRQESLFLLLIDIHKDTEKCSLSNDDE